MEGMELGPRGWSTGPDLGIADPCAAPGPTMCCKVPRPLGGPASGRPQGLWEASAQGMVHWPRVCTSLVQLGHCHSGRCPGSRGLHCRSSAGVWVHQGGGVHHGARVADRCARALTQTLATHQSGTKSRLALHSSGTASNQCSRRNSHLFMGYGVCTQQAGPHASRTPQVRPTS